MGDNVNNIASAYIVRVCDFLFYVCKACRAKEGTWKIVNRTCSHVSQILVYMSVYVCVFCINIYCARVRDKCERVDVRASLA